ncbi:MAG: hypothetical protein A2637_05155 [Candidatus Muproteobacteria bacterium RIFCSPHIGHO2_01_FULL_65_16]|uniref:Uncharacterized protein n=1 Tax=Candidatus Muproteobacteria bacterium RIFCSPHIGHO2_01_FULL_65_16 TaxID=1817764 RepID=A0A1F6TSB4_9PROT|nr:MAG: hypothetical protein A2637_05155 [Candidatus Muproteobacteria bacterium RIFCSPHIGHO2_01_FULL_65_16]
MPLDAYTTPAAARLVDFARVIGVPTADVRFSALWAKLAVKSFEGIAMNTKLSKLPVDERIKLVEELHSSLRQVINESRMAP